MICFLWKRSDKIKTWTLAHPLNNLMTKIISLIIVLALLPSTQAQELQNQADRLPGLVQLLNSKMFQQGLTICSTHPWRGVEYTQNLQLEYLQWVLNTSMDNNDAAFRKQVAQLIIKAGEDLQLIRKQCLALEQTSPPSTNKETP